MPALGHHGIRAVLLHRRWEDAHATRADVVCNGADFLSTSHRNMERAGKPAGSVLHLAADGLTGRRTVRHLAAP